MTQSKQHLDEGQQAPEGRSPDTPWQSLYAIVLRESLEARLRTDNETVARILGVLKPR